MNERRRRPNNVVVAPIIVIANAASVHRSVLAPVNGSPDAAAAGVCAALSLVPPRFAA
jgi:hypothetical protein